jgi:hypothetical protein
MSGSNAAEPASGSASNKDNQRAPFKKGKNARAYQGKKKDWDQPRPRPGRNEETTKKAGSDEEGERGEDGVKRLPKKKAAIMLGLASSLSCFS